MGVFLYKKKLGPKKEWGRQAAKEGNVPTKTCPNCGEQATPYEVYRDRITYKCSSCGAINTYTQIPAKKNDAPSKVQKLGGITLRDKSKPEKTQEQVVVTRDPKKAEDVFKDENLPSEEDESATVQTVNTIKGGMKDAKILEFTYISARGEETSRNVEPYKLTLDKKGDIILYGYCLEGRGIRTFKIQRMANCSKSNYSFDPQFPIEDKLVSYE